MGALTDLVTAGIDKGFSKKNESGFREKVNVYKLSFYNELVKVYGFIEKMRKDTTIESRDIPTAAIKGYADGNLSLIAILDFHLKKINEFYGEFETWCRQWGSKYPDSIKVFNDLGDFYNKILDFKKTLTNGNINAIDDFYIKARAEKELLEGQGVNLEENSAKTKKGGLSWGVCIALLIFLPPVGLICCIVKAVKK